jgi:hypothetical protein
MTTARSIGITGKKHLQSLNLPLLWITTVENEILLASGGTNTSYSRKTSSHISLNLMANSLP